MGRVASMVLGLAQGDEERRPPGRVVDVAGQGEGPGELGGGFLVGEGGDGAAGGLLGVVEGAAGVLVRRADRRGGGQPVAGEVGGVLPPGVAGHGGEGRAGGPVELHAPGGGEAVLDGVADEGVDEARRGGRAFRLGDEPGADGRVEGAQH